MQSLGAVDPGSRHSLEPSRKRREAARNAKDGRGARLLRLTSATAFVVSLLLTAASARGQGPQFDVGSPPGAAGGASTVGQPLGAANFPDFGSPSNAPFSGRAGPRGAHIPASPLRRRAFL